MWIKRIVMALSLVSMLLFLTIAGSLVEGADKVDTTAFISAPTTAEVGQVITIKMWIEPELPKSSGMEQSIHNATLIITHPKGITEYPIVLFKDGSLPFDYKPNQLGNITFQFVFPGETFNNGELIYKPSKSPVITVTITGDSVPPVEVPGGFWTEKQSMNQARGKLGVAAANGKIYAIGGYIENGIYITRPITGAFVGTNEEYNPETDTWTIKASMPTPRSNFAIATIENKIYCISGDIVGFKEHGYYPMLTEPIWAGTNEVYDTTTDTWETKAAMPTAAIDAKANVVNGKIYIFDGRATWVYNPEDDSWTTKASAPIKVGDYPSAVIGNKIYVISNYSPVQIYDTETDTWSQGKRSPRLDSDGVTAVTNGKFAPPRIYFFTVAQYGWVPYGSTDTSGSSRRTTFIYNPETDSWSAGTITPDYRVDFATATLDDKIYTIGGYIFNNSQSNTVNASAKNIQYTPIGYENPESESEVEGDHSNTDFPIAPVVGATFAGLAIAGTTVLLLHRRHKSKENK